ncbi:hypothetical protein [Sphingomonas changnyeongensis]|uniref:hypothetical protein n=1 Tax=Sphingomonas changnyeongensis TaxID=2698679 RepID=UPI00191BEE14|nr:hypothetical protein [Sphingomonas changnyeongensis]
MNEVTRIVNPMGGGVTEPTSRIGAVANTDQQRAIAEVQAAMMIARANPRNEVGAMDRILNACQRQGLAEAALYSYSRGGSEITGPSIRLAEALAQNWGNIQFGIREIEQRHGESVVQAFAWDVETNVRREMTFSVPHTRHTKRGSYKLEDPRDVYELVANNGSRRLRSCILAVIPGDVIDTAVQQCEATMRAKADTSPEALQKMVNAFAEFGVSQHQLEARIQRRFDTIQPAQIVALRKIYQSLRDNMSVPADWFDPAEGDAADEAKSTGNEAAKEALRKQTRARSPQSTETATPPAAAAGPSTSSEPVADGDRGDANDDRAEAVTLADALDQIDQATSPMDVNSRVSALLPGLTEEEGGVLRDRAVERIAKLKEAAK